MTTLLPIVFLCVFIVVALVVALAPLLWVSMEVGSGLQMLGALIWVAVCAGLYLWLFLYVFPYWSFLAPLNA